MSVKQRQIFDNFGRCSKGSFYIVSFLKYGKDHIALAALFSTQGERHKVYDKTDKMCTIKHVLPWLGKSIHLHEKVWMHQAHPEARWAEACWWGLVS